MYRPFRISLPPGPAMTAPMSWRERATECDGVQVDRAVPALMCLRGGDVIGAGTLALDAMIIDPGRLSHHDFRDTVRPIRTVAQRCVRLNDARTSFMLEYDEIARVRDNLVATRQEQQLDRLRDRRLGRHVNKCAFAHERRVQCRERPVLHRGVLAEILTNEIRSMGDDVGKTLDIVKERRRERTLKETVNEDQAITGF